MEKQKYHGRPSDQLSLNGNHQGSMPPPSEPSTPPKREVYRFLTSDAGVYLSSYQTMTVFHMRDLVAGKRRMIKAVDVKFINVPYFEGLSIDEMLEFARDRPERPLDVFPTVPRELEKLPR